LNQVRSGFPFISTRTVVRWWQGAMARALSIIYHL
jgi:hypothetical protein